jgi:hypothetical protein
MTAVLLMGWGLGLMAQMPVVVAYDSLADVAQRGQILAACPPNVELPHGFELAAARAVSHYPELAATHLLFRFERNTTAHSSRPRIASLFRSRAKRRYIIAISIHMPAYYTPGMLKNMPYNAQIGVLGHEIAHTVQYLSQSWPQLIRTGLRYQTSPAYVLLTEHKTDSIAIHHNLGHQLHAWASLARPLLAQAGRAQNYLSPAEIQAVMQILPQYSGH